MIRYLCCNKVAKTSLDAACKYISGGHLEKRHLEIIIITITIIIIIMNLYPDILRSTSSPTSRHQQTQPQTTSKRWTPAAETTRNFPTDGVSHVIPALLQPINNALSKHWPRNYRQKRRTCWRGNPWTSRNVEFKIELRLKLDLKSSHYWNFLGKNLKC